MDARLDFEAHPDRSLTLLLFKDVTNAEEIADKIKGGKFEPHVSCLNAEVIPDIFAVHLAAHKALTDESRSCMVTKSLHTELVYNLSGSKHISESLKRFGVGEGIKHLMVARFDATAEDMEAIKGLVSGKAVPLAELSSLTDSATIQKYYKISSQEAKLGPALDAVCCRMASRDC